MAQIDAPAGTYTAITAGQRHSCAIRTDATIACWSENRAGESDAPAGAYTAIAAGGGHTCALLVDATIACWGTSASGESNAPAGTYTAIAAGEYHSCAIRTDATTACWGGLNEYGQTEAPAGAFTAIIAGWRHSCAIRTDGTIACWGDNEDGQSDAPAGNFTAIANRNAAGGSTAEQPRRSVYGVSFDEPQPVAFHRDSATDEVLDPPRLEEWRYEDLEFSWRQHGDAAPFFEVVRAVGTTWSGFSITIHQGEQIDSLIRSLREFIPDDDLRIGVAGVGGAARAAKASWVGLSGDLNNVHIFAEAGDMTVEVAVYYSPYEHWGSDIVDKLAPLLESISLNSAEFPRR